MNFPFVYINGHFYFGSFYNDEDDYLYDRIAIVTHTILLIKDYGIYNYLVSTHFTSAVIFF